MKIAKDLFAALETTAREFSPARCEVESARRDVCEGGCLSRHWSADTPRRAGARDGVARTTRRFPSAILLEAISSVPDAHNAL
jgi:hypothetical protein